MIHSASVCDVDIRQVRSHDMIFVPPSLSLYQALYTSVVSVGGNSLLNGFFDRLNKDLSTKTPSVSTYFVCLY